MLTLAGYHEAGGVAGALAKRAEEVYPALDARRAQDGAADAPAADPARRGHRGHPPAGIDGELVTSSRRAEVRRVVEAFVGARLLVAGVNEVGEPYCDVAHEVLIRAWPRLRDWVDGGRDRLRALRRLTEASREWEAAGRDEALLYPEARVAGWTGADEGDLNDLERAFLAASRARNAAELVAAHRRAGDSAHPPPPRDRARGSSYSRGAGLVALQQRNQAHKQRGRALARRGGPRRRPRGGQPGQPRRANGSPPGSSVSRRSASSRPSRPAGRSSPHSIRPSGRSASCAGTTAQC